MPPKVTAVLFDLDGTLIDTETLVNGVASEVVAGYGKSLTAEVQQAALGQRPIEAWGVVAKLLELPRTAEELFAESEPKLSEKWQECKLLAGVQRLVDHLAAHGVPMAIGTSTSRETLEKKMCCKQRLAERFPVIVTGDEVVNGKPAPDIYLEVAARMGVKPEECLVVEDAPAGFQSGIAAGMQVVAVPSLPGMDPDITAGCAKVLPSLMDFDPKEFGLPAFEDCIHGVVPMKPEWYIKGAVVRGFGRGSATLGIPTANLPPESLMAELSGAVSGIYCGFASLGDSPEVYKMVMSIGWNPYFKNTHRTAEPWILHEFKEPFYGEELRLVVCGYIRPEANFTTLEALIARIHEDAAVTRKALEAPALASYAANAYLKPPAEASAA
mmetsp:Transcript_30941/g.79450  ORF Transcript_30941/g.79450 Transcript_30941/m.79450 type:complete len:384 (+) Transcript_30941:264-1415(+)|eukprot:jgi/Tetstr1/443239/TSEL_031277.t1